LTGSEDKRRTARRLPSTAGDGRLDAVGHRDAVWQLGELVTVREPSQLGLGPTAERLVPISHFAIFE
jgi:hypothetical protein